MTLNMDMNMTEHSPKHVRAKQEIGIKFPEVYFLPPIKGQNVWVVSPKERDTEKNTTFAPLWVARRKSWQRNVTLLGLSIGMWV